MKTFPLGILNANSSPSRRTALLYEFILGGEHWRYTSAKDAISFDAGSGAHSYAPAAVTHDVIYNSGGPDDRPTTIKAGHIDPFNTFVGHDFPSELRVEIRRVWLDDLSFGDLIFAGSVDNVNDGDEGLEIECRGILSKLDQAFPALIVSPTCTLETYSAQCGLNRADFNVVGNIISINRNAVEVAELAAKPDGFFAHGYAEAGGVKIGIEGHVGAFIQLNVPPTVWQVGDALTVYWGDNHTLATCRDKFANEANFLGLGIGMPDRNPVVQTIK